MRLATYNIQYGFGADGCYDLSRAAAAVCDCDIVALQEVERFWDRSGFDDQPQRLGAMLPDHHWVFGPAFDMDASFRDGEGRLVNRRRQFGTMLLSRLPIVWSRLHCLPMRRVVHPLNTQNAALECLVETPAGPLRIVVLHLSHIGVEERLTQLDFLLDRHRRVPAEGGPWSGTDDEPMRNWTQGLAEPPAPLAAVWMGDFNAEPGSAEYLRMTGDNPNRPGAAYYDAFVDAAVAAGGRREEGHTHSRIFQGRAQRRRLDYCFVGAMLGGRVLSYRVDDTAEASDHLPVFVEIDLETPGRWA